MNSDALADGGPELTDDKFFIFVRIAVLLAAVTGLEVFTVYTPFAHGTLFVSLVAASAVKFLFVIFVFMHLRWDRPLCTLVFSIGLILGGGTMWALLTLFSSAASMPPSGP